MEEHANELDESKADVSFGTTRTRDFVGEKATEKNVCVKCICELDE